MNAELLKKLKEILNNTEIDTIDLEYSNEYIDSIYSRVWSHYSKIIEDSLEIPYPFFLSYKKLKFVVEDDMIFIKLSEDNAIENYINSCCSNNMPFHKEESLFEGIKNIKSPDELKEKYPDIYEIYDKNSSSNKYEENFDLFINDICDYFEILLDNETILTDAFNKNLYRFSLKNEDEFYSIVYNILFEYLRYESIVLELTNNEDIRKYEIDIFRKQLAEIMGIINKYSKSKSLELHSKNKVNKLSYYNIALDPLGLKNDFPLDYLVSSHGKEISIPIFYDDSILIDLFLSDMNLGEGVKIENTIDITQYYLAKYSGLFEYAFSDKNDKFLLGLKNEYNNKEVKELFEIALKNLRKYKEKDMDLVPVGSTETKLILYFNDPNREASIYSSFIKLLNKKIKFKASDYFGYEQIHYFLLAYCYYGTLGCINEIDKMHIKDIVSWYENYLNQMKAVKNKFIKFADKSYLIEQDFKNAEKKLYLELESRIGKDKINEILEKLKDTSFEDKNAIIDACLIEKKSIDDEIKIIEKKRNDISKTSPEYRVLNQRLNKLLLYKNEFNSETVIDGDGVFTGYYGFEFDGLYVFDYFSDMDEEDVLKKAKKDYGNRIFILTAEDYSKVRNLKSRLEVIEYIKDNLEPCADKMNHTKDGEKDKIRLLKKLEDIKNNIKKREYVINLLETDNPVTDDEIKITQEEFDYYASRFTSIDVKKNFERERNVNKVRNNKSGQETKESLTRDDELDFNDDIESIYVLLQKINIERINNNLKTLSFENDNFYDVYAALIEYEKEHPVKRKVKRDPNVAYATKERTFHDGVYHCELCGDIFMNPVFLESHHYIPISKGGPDDIYNTVCLCSKCHTAIHNGLVTDYQNYQLIETIKKYITSHAPEALSLFEKTLGFKDNFYLEQLDKIDLEISATNSEMEKTIDKDLPQEDVLKEIDDLQSKIDDLKSQKEKLMVFANRLQDIYRNSNEYLEIEEKTNISSKK